MPGAFITFMDEIGIANDQAIKWAKAKVCVCADSVLCVGQMRDTPEAIERWESQLEGLRLYSSYHGAVVSMEKQLNSS